VSENKLISEEAASVRNRNYGSRNAKHDWIVRDSGYRIHQIIGHNTAYGMDDGNGTKLQK